MSGLCCSSHNLQQAVLRKPHSSSCKLKQQARIDNIRNVCHQYDTSIFLQS